MSKKEDFVEIDCLHDEDGLGLVAPITVRKKGRDFTAFSFAIFKEFEPKRGGPVQRTLYLNYRHIEAAQKLLSRVQDRIEVERDKLFRGRRVEQSRRAKAG